MLHFNSLDELYEQLQAERTKNLYAEQEANEAARNWQEERDRYRAEQERQKLETLKEREAERKARREAEREAEQARAEQREKQRKHDNRIFITAIITTFLTMLTSAILFLAIVLRY